MPIEGAEQVSGCGSTRGPLAAPSFCPCPRSTSLAILWLFSVGKKTATGRRGCLFMPPDANGPHGAAQGPAGANAKRPPRAWGSPKREGAFVQIFLA
nr:MAG TPA: hypothetical protein [Caudoviricetes sp.]